MPSQTMEHVGRHDSQHAASPPLTASAWLAGAAFFPHRFSHTLLVTSVHVCWHRASPHMGALQIPHSPPRHVGSQISRHSILSPGCQGGFVILCVGATWFKAPFASGSACFAAAAT